MLGAGRRAGGRVGRARRAHHVVGRIGFGRSPSDARLLRPGRYAARRPGPRGGLGQATPRHHGSTGRMGANPAQPPSTGLHYTVRAGGQGPGDDRQTRTPRLPTRCTAAAPAGRRRSRSRLGQHPGSRRVLPSGQTRPGPRGLGRGQSAGVPHSRRMANSRPRASPWRTWLDRRRQPAVRSRTPAHQPARHPRQPSRRAQLATGAVGLHRTTRPPHLSGASQGAARAVAGAAALPQPPRPARLPRPARRRHRSQPRRGHHPDPRRCRVPPCGSPFDPDQTARQQGQTPRVLRRRAAGRRSSRAGRIRRPPPPGGRSHHPAADTSHRPGPHTDTGLRAAVRGRDGFGQP